MCKCNDETKIFSIKVSINLMISLGLPPNGIAPTELHPNRIAPIGIAPTYDCTHGISPTQDCTHRDCTQTELHPHGVAPTRNCTHTEFHPQGIVPTKGLHPHRIAPTQDCTHTGLHPYNSNERPRLEAFDWLKKSCDLKLGSSLAEKLKLKLAISWPRALE